MRCRISFLTSCLFLTPLLIAGLIGCAEGGNEKPKGTNQDLSLHGKAETPSADTVDASHPKLLETSPPPGLPIIPWGKRDHFPVIRRPEYWTGKEAEAALAYDEPILGLVIGNETRAYSTNQLNDHEMVIDTIAGIPVLVSY
jgi:hypothetical protein